jgi:RES domain-containing protein
MEAQMKSTAKSDASRNDQGTGHGEKLARKEQAAIVALLAHPTIPEAAKAAGISETTLWRWLQRDDFREKYRKAQDKVFDGALASLQGATMQAVNTLLRNLSCKNPSAEVQAARAILHYGLKSHDIFDTDQRIAKIEGAIQDREEADEARRSFGQDPED